jgi:hypothetical protein
MCCYLAKQVGECYSVANAGSERGESLRKGLPSLEPFGLGNWKWEKAQLRLSVSTHRQTSSPCTKRYRVLAR